MYSSVSLNYSRKVSGALSIDGCALFQNDSSVYYNYPVTYSYIHDDLALSHFRFGMTLDQVSFLPTGGAQPVYYLFGPRQVDQYLNQAMIDFKN